MRRYVCFGWAAIMIGATGCSQGPASLADEMTRPAARGTHRGDIADAQFTTDSKALFGRPLSPGQNPHNRHEGGYALWDVVTGRERWRTPLDRRVMGFVPGTADGKNWLTFGSHGDFKLRHIFTEFTPERRYVDIDGGNGPIRPATRPSYNSDFSRFAYCAPSMENGKRQGYVYAREEKGWKWLMSMPGEEARLSPDGKRVVTVAADRSTGGLILRVWSVANGEPLWTAKGRTDRLPGFTADGKYLVADEGERKPGERKYSLYDAATGDVHMTLAVPPQSPTAYRDGKIGIAQKVPDTRRSVLVTWDVQSGKEIGRRQLPEGARPEYTRGQPFAVPVLAVVTRIESRPVPGKMGRSIPVVTVDVFDPAKSDPLATIRFNGRGYVMVSPDGRSLVTLSDGPAFYQLPAGR